MSVSYGRESVALGLESTSASLPQFTRDRRGSRFTQGLATGSLQTHSSCGEFALSSPRRLVSSLAVEPNLLTGGNHMAKFDATNQRGLKAVSLATKHAEELDPRLPAGHTAYLQATLEKLGAAVPNQRATRAEAQQSSRAQHDAFDDLVALLSAIRTNVRNDADATSADRKEYSVGVRLDSRVPKATLAAAAGVIRVAKAKPQRAQELGILPTDIARLEALHLAAAAADTAEDTKRATAPLSTKMRDTLNASVEAAIRKIAGAGVVAFAFDPTVRAEFEELLERSGSARRGPQTPA